MLPGEILSPLCSLDLVHANMDSSPSHIHCESPESCRELLVSIEQDLLTVSQVGEGIQARTLVGPMATGQLWLNDKDLSPSLPSFIF